MNIKNKIISLMLAAVMALVGLASLPFTALAGEVGAFEYEAKGTLTSPVLDGVADTLYGEEYTFKMHDTKGSNGVVKLRFAWDESYVYMWAYADDIYDHDASSRGLDNTSKQSPHLYLYLDFGNGETLNADGRAAYYAIGLSRSGAKVLQGETVCSARHNGNASADSGDYYCIENKADSTSAANNGFISKFKLAAYNTSGVSNTKCTTAFDSVFEIAIPKSTVGFKTGDTLSFDVQYAQINGDSRYDTTLSGTAIASGGKNDIFKTTPSALGCELTLIGEAGDGSTEITAPYADGKIVLDGFDDSAYSKACTVDSGGSQKLTVKYAWDENNIYVWAEIRDDADRTGNDRCLDPVSPTANASPHAYLYFDFGGGAALDADNRESYLMLGLPRAGLKQLTLDKGTDVGNSSYALTNAVECLADNSGHDTPTNKDYFYFADGANDNAFIEGCKLWVRHTGVSQTGSANSTVVEISIPCTEQMKLGDTIRTDVQFATYDGGVGSNRTDYTLGAHLLTEGGVDDDFKTNPDTLGCVLTLGAESNNSDFERVGGHDGANGVYYIKTAEQFADCFERLYHEDDSSEYVDKIVLLDNIDMAAYNARNGGNSFNSCNGWSGGNFDGQGYSVSNIVSNVECRGNCKNGACENNGGLLSEVHCDTVFKNVAFLNMTVKCNSKQGSQYGMLVGYADNCDISFENVVVSGSASRTQKGSETLDSNSKIGYLMATAGKSGTSGNSSISINSCVFVLTEPSGAEHFSVGWLMTGVDRGSADVTSSYALGVNETLAQGTSGSLSEFLDSNGKPTSLTESKSHKFQAADEANALTPETLGTGFTFDGSLPMPKAFASNTDVNVFSGNMGLLGDGMVYGASVRLDDTSGIRFSAELDFKELESKFGKIDEYGIIIVEKTVLNGGIFTMDALESYINTNSKDGTLNTYVKNGKTRFTFAVTDVDADKYCTVFCARAYVKVGDRVYYTTYSDTANARSIAGVAEIALQREKETIDDSQQTNLEQYINGGRGELIPDVVSFSDYSLVWTDEFNREDGFSDTWQASYSEILNVNDYEYEGLNGVHNVLYIEDGTLNFTAKKDGDIYYGPMGLTTAASMNYAGGYLEIRAKGIAAGYQFAMWTQAAEHSAKLIPDEKRGQDYFLEVDLVEAGNNGSIASTVHHGWGNNGPHNRTDVWSNGNLVYDAQQEKWWNIKSYGDIDAWHTYGMLWTETEVVFYFDGQEYYRTKIFEGYGAKPSEAAAYVIIGGRAWSPDFLENGPDWHTMLLGGRDAESLQGQYDENGDYNITVSIDYVRLYQSNDAGVHQEVYVK